MHILAAHGSWIHARACRKLLGAKGFVLPFVCHGNNVSFEVEADNLLYLFIFL